MLILAIDTAQGPGSVSLARGNQSGIEILGTAAVDGGTFSARLVPTLAGLLKAHHASQRDLEGIAVTTGPGSFTGLRIGLTAAKGLAEALGVPLVGVSRFAAVAESFAGGADPLFVALDAGRGEIYAAEFRRVDSSWSLGKKWLSHAPDMAEAIRKAGPAAASIASEPLVAENLKTSGIMACLTAPPNSEAIARLGWRQLAAGEAISVDALDAEYIRRDGELFSKR